MPRLYLLLTLLYLCGANQSCKNKSNVCNGNGVAYISNDCVCECFQCWYGSKCQYFNDSTSCLIDLGRAQPYLQWQCWAESQNGKEDPIITINAGYLTPYSFGINGRANFPGLDLYQDLVQELSVFHAQPWVNNLNTTGKTLVIGNGATHLNVAAVYAVGQQMKQQGIPVPYHFSQTPCYDSIPYPSRYCEGVGANYCQTNFSLNLNASEVIEWIVSPNNPDNKLQPPYYPTARHIHDSVYHFPWLTALPVSPRDVDIAVYSLSKTTGHSGTRFGWAWVKDPQVANMMRNYVSATSSFAPAVEAVYRAREIIKHMNTGSNGINYANCVRNKLHARWDAVLAVLSTSTSYVSESEPYGVYLWLRCLGKTSNQCVAAFKAAGVTGVTSGNSFQGLNHVRIPMIHADSVSDEFLARFTALVQS